jgi:hypothetical protein
MPRSRYSRSKLYRLLGLLLALATALGSCLLAGPEIVCRIDDPRCEEAARLVVAAAPQDRGLPVRAIVRPTLGAEEVCALGRPGVPCPWVGTVTVEFSQSPDVFTVPVVQLPDNPCTRCSHPRRHDPAARDAAWGISLSSISRR